MKKILSVFVLMVTIATSSHAGQLETFEKKCNSGEGDACATLGALYAGFSKSNIVDKDMNKAIQYWKKGCELGSGSACTTYAVVIDDIPTRIEILKKACDLGNENGCLTLKQTVKIVELNNECYVKNNIQSCTTLGGEIYLTGEFGVGKEILEEACNKGEKKACSNMTILNELKGLKSLSFVQELIHECDKTKDRYACEKAGTFLIQTTDPIMKNAKSKEEKSLAAKEVMGNTLFAVALLKEACKLGRNESCRTLNGLMAMLEGKK